MHRPRKTPTNTYGRCWPPTPCCVTPLAAPTTTAQPPAPPTPPQSPQGPTPADRPPAGRVQIPITHHATTTTAAHVSDATIAGRPGAPAPIAAIVQNDWRTTRITIPPTEDRMSTDTSSALDQPTMSGATPKPPRDKVMRIATMTKQLLDEVRTQPLDTAGLDRLRTIDTQIIGELLTDLSPDLRQELQRLALPLTRHTELSDAELRLAHAQLVGWLQGLLQTTQTALADPHAVLANDSLTVQAATDTSTSSDIPTSPNHLDRPHFEPCSPTSTCPMTSLPTRTIQRSGQHAKH